MRLYNEVLGCQVLCNGCSPGSAILGSRDALNPKLAAEYQLPPGLQKHRKKETKADHMRVGQYPGVWQCGGTPDAGTTTATAPT